MKTLGAKAFYCCHNLVSIRLSDPIKVIPEECFAECENLREVKLPAALESIGYKAFSECAALTEITLPGIPANAGAGVFEGWTSEQTINFSNSEADLADLVEDGLLDGCEATVNYED